MKPWLKWVLAACAIAAVAAAGYWFGSRGGTSAGSNASGSSPPDLSKGGPVVAVSTAAIERKRITEVATVYGRVVAQPGDLQVVSLPYDANVVHVLVAPGEPVRAGQALVRVTPSPATTLQVDQARAAFAAATRTLQQVQQEYAQHLAVSTQLITAEKDADAARLRLAQLEREGATGAHTVTARQSGIVNAIGSQDGQLATAGTPLVSIAIRDRLEVRFGVEPEDLPYVHVGDAIQISPVHALHPLVATARVRVVGGKVDPATQLIDVEASLPAGIGFTLTSFIEGKLAAASDVGLVVPREALLPKGGRYQLFTVRNGKAEQHMVDAGLETDREMEIVDKSLRAGELAVTQGNYELSPGMAVSTQGQP
jgi:membrane fusion protein (multidrug efflux system)